MTPKAFHDAVLRENSIPIKLLAKRLRAATGAPNAEQPRREHDDRRPLPRSPTPRGPAPRALYRREAPRFRRVGLDALREPLLARGGPSLIRPARGRGRSGGGGGAGGVRLVVEVTGPARAEHLYKWADAIAARAGELAAAMVRRWASRSARRGARRRGPWRSSAITPARLCARWATSSPPRCPARFPVLRATAAGRRGADHALELPLAIPLWKAAPAKLAMGNTVVLKPAEPSATSPRSSPRRRRRPDCPRVCSTWSTAGGRVGGRCWSTPRYAA